MVKEKPCLLFQKKALKCSKKAGEDEEENSAVNHGTYVGAFR